MTPAKAEQQEEQTSFPLIAGFLLFSASVAFVILALTGYTYQLDDIKNAGLHVGGGLCLAVWAALWMSGQVRLPPAAAWGAFAAYIMVSILSTLSAREYVQWIGWNFVFYHIATFGYVLLGASIIVNRAMAEYSLKFWVVLTFVTTAFGVLHYGGVLGAYYNMVYPSPPSGPDQFHDVLNTFRMNRGMLSTILNVQFFGNFLLLCLPACAAAGVLVLRNLETRLSSGEPIIWPIFWLILSAISILFSIACILLTYSKSSIPILPLQFLMFAGGLYFVAKIRTIPHPKILLLAVLILLILGGLIFSQVWTDFQSRFKGLEENLGPRAIIFSGALNIFADQPLLGGGPGSFRLLFPEYRDPNYHLNRVSNLTLYAHNWLLDIMAETGIFGTLTYLAFLAAIAWLAFVTMRKNNDPVLRVAALGCAIGVISILIGASLTPMTRWPVGTVSLHAMLGTLLGISALGVREIENEPTRRSMLFAVFEPESGVRLGALVFAGIFAVYSYQWSSNWFHARILHNEGIKHSEYRGAPVDAVAAGEPHTSYFRHAIDNFEKSLDLYPTSPTTLYKLGNAYSRMTQHEDSLDAYRRLSEIAPDYSEIHYNVAVVNYTLARQLEDQIQSAKGEQKAALIKRRNVHYQASAKSFERATELSNKINVWYFRGATLVTGLAAGAFPESESEELFRRAGEILETTAELPLSTVIQEENQLQTEKDLRFRAYTEAVTAYEQGRDYAKAAEMAERALEISPERNMLLRRAVANHQRAEQPDGALRVVDNILADNPLNSEVRQIRFEILATTNRRREALEEGYFMLTLNEKISTQSEPFLPKEREAQLRQTLQALENSQS